MDGTRTKLKITKDSDIRRISVPQNVTYPEFLKVLGYLYGPLSSTIVLKYLDDENDLISFTNDRELKEALQAPRKSSVLKVSVVSPVVQEKQDAPEEAARVYHEAYCNNCGEDIYDIRYKCGNCEDFDLCETCEALWSSDLSIHNVTHTFLKIYTPLSARFACSTILPETLYESDKEILKQEAIPDLDQDDDTLLEELENAVYELQESQRALNNLTFDTDDICEPCKADLNPSPVEVIDDLEWATDEEDNSDDCEVQEFEVLEQEPSELPPCYDDAGEAIVECGTPAYAIDDHSPQDEFGDADDLALVDAYIAEASADDAASDSEDEGAMQTDVAVVAFEELQEPNMESIPAVEEPAVVVSFWKRLQTIFRNDTWHDEWATLLSQMEEMGFNDQARNKEYLISHRGNLNAAVDALLAN